MQERYQAQLVQAMSALQDLQAEVAAVTAQARETDAELAGARDDRRHLLEHHRAATQQVNQTPVGCACTGILVPQGDEHNGRWLEWFIVPCNSLGGRAVASRLESRRLSNSIQ